MWYLRLYAGRLALRGLKGGQEIEFKVCGGVISILPKPPAADDEYTPKQRRIIDAGLAKADADIKAGRVSKALFRPQRIYRRPAQGSR